MPFPLTAGDRIYSYQLAAALAASGADLTFVGLSAEVPPKPTPGIHWHPMPGGPSGNWRGIASSLPLVAARHATRAYRAEAARLLRSREWDVVIVEHYGVAWLCSARVGRHRPVRVFITHNHEAGVAWSQYRNAGPNVVKKAYYWQNWRKTQRLEAMAARHSDLITTIQDRDAQSFAGQAPHARTLVLTPGYSGVRLNERTMTRQTPRSVVLFGSYRWSAKQASLMMFLAAAAPVLGRAGIGIDVVGDIDPQLRQQLAGQYPAVAFHGYVDDASTYLRNARLAVVAEPVGGGFKLKLLEYIFNRVPIAALRACVQGLPETVHDHMIIADDMTSLLGDVVSSIDHVEWLDRLQQGAFDAAAPLFDWAERGRRLFEAIDAIQDRHATRTRSPHRIGVAVHAAQGNGCSA